MTNTNTLLAFGDSDTWKTTNLCYAAKYMYEKTGLPVRWIASEPVIPYLQSLVDAGMVHLCHVGGAVENPLVVLRKLSVGAWPERQATGQWMMKMLDTAYAKHLHLVGQKYSAYVIDTIDSLGELLLEDLRSKARKISEEPVGLFTEEDEKFAANPKSHYGFVQREILARMASWSGLAVERVLFAAHERRAEDDDEAKTPIRGPALVGKAATARIPKDVGTLIHCEKVTESVDVMQDGKKVSRVTNRSRWYFVSHPDPQIPRVTYSCKPRFPPDQIKPLMEKWPGGYFEPGLEYGGTGLDAYLRFEDELLAKQTGAEKEWKAKVDAARAPKIEAVK